MGLSKKELDGFLVKLNAEEKRIQKDIDAGVNLIRKYRHEINKIKATKLKPLDEALAEVREQRSEVEALLNKTDFDSE